MKWMNSANNNNNSQYCTDTTNDLLESNQTNMFKTLENIRQGNLKTLVYRGVARANFHFSIFFFLSLLQFKKSFFKVFYPPGLELNFWS